MKAITSEAPTSTKWVDVRKMNDDGEEFMRSRLVARDFRPRRGPDRPDLFAAMPPLEAKKMLFIMTVAGGAFEQRGSKDEQKLMFIDVRKAHLNGVVDDQEWVFVELPPEFHVYGRFARIRRWLYGMRKAAISWEKNYAEKLAAVGFKGSRAAPTTFYNPATKVRLVVHGDDFTFSGTQVELEKIRGLFKKWYDVKDRGIMGSGTRDIKEVVILGRTLKFTEMGLEYTADGKHRDAILEELGLESESKSLGCPALGADKMDEPGDENELLKEDVTSFRSVAARSNYLGMDRPDIQYGVKELCATMSRPTQRSWRQLKQLGRYLVGKADMTWEYKAGARTDMIDVYVDSDWAGDRQQRKSTSGGLVIVGGIAVKSWSRTQRGRSLSSAEAEYYAIVTGVAEALAVQALAEEMGWKMSVRVHTDSSAAKAVASRRGLGKLRHIELKYLWVQELVQEQRIAIKKINGLDNPADCLTKPKDFKCFEPLLSRFGARWRSSTTRRGSS